MFEAYKAKKRAAAEAAELAAYRARDAEVGIPTGNTMDKRLQKAALKGMWDVVDDCLKKGMDVNSKVDCETKLFSGRFFWPLFKLCRGDTSAGIPLISIAIMRKEWKAAENLLAQGADPAKIFVAGSRKYRDIYTPMDIAVIYNNPDMVQKLCDSGAYLLHSPLCLAEERGHNDIIKIIRAEEVKRTQGQTHVNPATPEAAGLLEGVTKLPEASRDWLLASLRQRFPVPEPVAAAPEGLAEDVVVPKPITLKQKGQPDV